MAVRPAYAMTEVGILPEDWKTPSLGSLTVLMTNGFVGEATSHYTENGEGVRYIQGYNVMANSFNFHGIKYVTKDFHRSHSKSCLRPGDLLTIQTGDIGLTAEVPESLAGSNCHALIISRFDQKSVFPAFISYYLNSGPGRARLRLIETGTTMKHLNVGDMLQFVVPLPPTKNEQEAIAEALSDADAYIESLEKLIVKKRQIKQGAMQELLTGKRRLPGFSGEWEVMKLEKIGQTYGGLTGLSKPDFGVGDSRYITFMNIMSHVIVNLDELESVNVRSKGVQNRAENGDLFFNGSSETPEEVGMCALLANDVQNVYLNSFCFGFRLFDNTRIHGLYLAYYFRSGQGRKLLNFLAQGATRYNLSKRSFLQLRLPLPCYKEQSAISSLLSEFDQELASLVSEFSKAQHLKQSMMQQLLTGRIRLV